MSVTRVIGALAVAAGLATVTLPAGQAGAAVSVEAVESAARPLPCGGGYARMAAPWRSGAYIKISTIAHCDRYTGPIGRSGYIDARLDQYRGLGVWRNKAYTRRHFTRAAVTFTMQPAWRCSGGNQLYRNHTKGWIAQGGSGTRSFGYTEQRRISC
ncbi:hypothetical protein ACIBHY_24975 [Nonomuraea sp. NPDC050547]|uniref:hypothetical protein n=1 Tax=Nonomuraea sp. NPDC050547 TaxID=3364368 RepID=UPI003787B0F7